MLCTKLLSVVVNPLAEVTTPAAYLAVEFRAAQADSAATRSAARPTTSGVGGDVHLQVGAILHRRRGVARAGQEVRVRVPEQAAVVVDGHVPDAPAVFEGGVRREREAGRAPAAVDVAAAEREAPRLVWGVAERGGGEAYGGAGRVGEQGPEERDDVGAVGGVKGVGAAVVAEVVHEAESVAAARPVNGEEKQQ